MNCLYIITSLSLKRFISWLILSYEYSKLVWFTLDLVGLACGSNGSSSCFPRVGWGGKTDRLNINVPQLRNVFSTLLFYCIIYIEVGARFSLSALLIFAASVLYTVLYTVQCTVHCSVYCTLFTVQCTGLFDRIHDKGQSIVLIKKSTH